MAKVYALMVRHSWQAHREVREFTFPGQPSFLEGRCAGGSKRIPGAPPVLSISRASPGLSIS
jgi:hypothetical protein